MTPVPWRLLLRYFRAAMVLAVSCASAGLAQEHPLQSLVQGDLAPGVPQIYTVRGGAGDLIFGTFELRGEPTMRVTVALYDESGSKVRELEEFSQPGHRRIGFVTPKNVAYRIRITATSPAGASYTLRTERQTPAERMAGAAAVTPTVRFESARVAQLAKDVSAGRGGAVESFWSEAEMRGGPLVETIAGNDQNVLVTFVWKETYETHNVLVVWHGAAPQDYYMSRIPRTNVWYKTVRVLRGSRFSYRLAPNARREPNDSYTAQIDTLNPRAIWGDWSILETPKAPDNSWYSRTPSVRGSITQHSADSALLKRRRDFSVYTPPGYSPSNGPYALLILFDGRGYADGIIGAPNTLDNLIADHRIRPTVVCFVRDNRGVNPDQRQTYAAAMATELVPWLRASYAVSTKPNDVVIGGFSAGGGTAGYVAFWHPNVFGNVLLQSGGGGVLVPLYIDAPKVPVRFYIDQGLYEYGPTWATLSPDEQAIDGWSGDEFSPQGVNWLLRQRLLRDILRAKGYDVTYHETGGGHEAVHWRATLAEGLIALLGEPTK